MPEEIKQLILKLPESLHTKLKTIAAQKKTTTVQLIKDMINKIEN